MAAWTLSSFDRSRESFSAGTQNKIKIAPRKRREFITRLRSISERTKAALQAAKARGVRLDNPEQAKAAKPGVAAVRANARQFAANVLPIIEEIERAGITSHNAIAAKLNERNVRTARGGKWTHVQVGAVLRPFEQSAAVAVVWRGRSPSSTTQVARQRTDMPRHTRLRWGVGEELAAGMMPSRAEPRDD